MGEGDNMTDWQEHDTFLKYIFERCLFISRTYELVGPFQI